MANEDWFGIISPGSTFSQDYSEDFIFAYRKLLERLGIQDIIELPLLKDRNNEDFIDAHRVGKIIRQNKKKPLLLGLEHCLTAFANKHPPI